jgi:hypothetical protein
LACCPDRSAKETNQELAKISNRAPVCPLRVRSATLLQPATCASCVWLIESTKYGGSYPIYAPKIRYFESPSRRLSGFSIEGCHARLRPYGGGSRETDNTLDHARVSQHLCCHVKHLVPNHTLCIYICHYYSGNSYWCSGSDFAPAFVGCQKGCPAVPSFSHSHFPYLVKLTSGNLLRPHLVSASFGWSFLRFQFLPPLALTAFQARPFLQLPTPCPICETSCSHLYALVRQACVLYLEKGHWCARE